MSEFTKVRARDLNSMQHKAVRRVVCAFRNSEAYNGVTSVRFTLSRCEYFVSMQISTRRSDCAKYSPRQVFCANEAHLFIGKRGGITIASARSGLRTGKAHTKHVLRYCA